MFRHLLLASTALLAVPSFAQPAPDPREGGAPAPADGPAVDDGSDEDEADQEIVVTALRERGAVLGDIPAENQLSPADIRATGATSVTELLDNIAIQTGSSRGRGGGAPVVLLNGRRTSGFQELRDLPPEAIYRVDILPEEVALKYGYRADQRVVNIVLRPRFRSTAARGDVETTTEGGRAGGEIDVTRLLIQDKGRVSLNVHAERNSRLLESDRDILLQPVTIGGASVDPRGFRTLAPERTQLRLGGTYNRTLFDNVGATVDARLERVTSNGLFGPDVSGIAALNRDSTTDSGRLGFAFNGNRDRWRWSADGAYELNRTVTTSDRSLAPLDIADRGRATNGFGNFALVATGPLAELPAGRSNLTLRVSADTRDLDSRSRRGLLVTDTKLGRDRIGAAANADFPIARRNGPLSAIGNLTLNANAEIERLSDFGTLFTYGGGLSWSPVERLNLIASYTREEGAPGLEQLGNPLLDSPGSRLFDFVSGTTVLTTVRTGGSPALLADNRSVWKLGGTWRPLVKTDIDLRVDYTRSRLRDPVSSFPGPTLAIQSAFPDRFVRDPAGNLLLADLRSVNFERADRETLRYGLNWSKPLQSRRPTAAQIDRLRQSFGRPGGGQTRGTQPQGTQPQGTQPSAAAPQGDRSPAGGQGAGAAPGGPRGGGGGGGRGFGGFGGGGGPFGGGQGGRLQLSLYHTVNLKDEVLIRPGLPVIDYLSGEAVDGGGGRPRHQLELEGGWFNNGFGVRGSAEWRGASRVAGGPSGDLRFSPFARANLRLFANLGEQFDLVARRPWLRGTQVRLEINNLFDSKPRVRDALGQTPVNYQPDLIDPAGRTVSLSLRKLFIPARFRQQARQRAQGGRPE